MKFTYDPSTNTVESHKTLKAAKELVAANLEADVIVFDSDNLDELTTAQLLAIYNAKAEKPITRFATRDAALSRTLSVLTEKAEPKSKLQVVTKTNPEKVVTEKQPKVKKEKAPKAEGEKRGRKAGVSSKFGGKTLFAQNDVNPRRVGSLGFNSYELIRGNKAGVKFEDYIAAGGRAKDLQWDIDAGFTKVK